MPVTDDLDREELEPTATVRYGALAEHLADVWAPPAVRREPAALVIVVHGGFWRARYDRIHARPMCRALADQGYPVAAIEYRRTGQAGGGWPGTFDDVRAAVEAVPDLAAAALGLPIGPVVLIGHSAGGQLVLWAGSRCAIRGLAGLVSLAGVCDLVRADELHLGRQRDRGAVRALLGGSPAQVPERYAAADPMQVPVPTVPVVLIHGTADDVVPIELSRRYAARAAEAGPRPTSHGLVELVELDGVDHFDPIDPLAPAWGAVLDALSALTRQ
jgi:acetyl esterase/lipase